MQKRSKIKHLIFDIGGVIVLPRGKFDFTKFDKQFSLAADTVKKIVDSAFQKSMVDKSFDIKKYLKENFSDTLTYQQYQKVTTALYSKEKVNKTLTKWIKKKRKSYKVSLLTNNTSSLRRLLRKKFQISDIFDFVFNSAEIGLAKPEPKFFKYLLQKLKAKPEECLFIDDNQKNIEKAKELGFVTILFKSNKKFIEGVIKLKI